MSYSAGEALVLITVRKASSFGTDNSARRDWRILDNAQADTYAVLRQGRMVRDRANSGVTVIGKRWQTVIEVWERHGTDITATASSLEGHVAEIEAALYAWPHLTSEATVTDSEITSIEEPMEMWPRARGASAPKWLRQNIILEWLEQVQVTYSE